MNPTAETEQDGPGGQEQFLKSPGRAGLDIGQFRPGPKQIAQDFKHCSGRNGLDQKWTPAQRRRLSSCGRHRLRKRNGYNGICLVGHLSNRTFFPKICLTGQIIFWESV